MKILNTIIIGLGNQSVSEHIPAILSTDRYKLIALVDPDLSRRVDDDEKLLEALKRELKEETGLNISQVNDVCNKFDYTSKSGKKTRQFNFIVTVEDAEHVRLNTEEHDNFVWVDIENADSVEIIDDTMKSIVKTAAALINK